MTCTCKLGPKRGTGHEPQCPCVNSASAQEPEEWSVEEAEGFKFVLDESGNILLTFPEVVEAHNAAISSLAEELKETRERLVNFLDSPQGEVVQVRMQLETANNACDRAEKLNDELEKKVSSLREKMKVLEEKEPSKAGDGQTQNTLLLDSLSALLAISPFYRRNPVWEKARISETIDALQGFLSEHSNENQSIPPLTKDAEILSLRAELQEAEKLLKRIADAACDYAYEDDCDDPECYPCSARRILKSLELKEPNSDRVNVETQKALLPCPFCGSSDARWTDDPNYFRHRSDPCPLDCMQFKVDKWNARSGDSSVLESNENQPTPPVNPK